MKREIQRVEQQLSDQARQRSSSLERLRSAEKAEAAARRDLREIRLQVGETQSTQSRLTEQASAADEDLDQQKRLLSEELRRSWMSGREEWLRLMVNQQDPAALGRQLTWLSYVGDQRRMQMQDLEGSLRRISQLQAGLSDESRRLEALQQTEQRRLDDLSESRRERTQALARLDREIAGDRKKVQNLQAEEQALNQLLTDLARATAMLPEPARSAFAKAGRNLDWPTDGRLIRRFGQSRAGGQMKWEGVVLEAPAGADDRAVQGGRVIFADWLQGLGLLMVIEHGGEYMSLYANNQDLMRDVGDQVSPGEIIAHVGDSGGQALPGLYFEIRHRGRPMDPQTWIR